MHDREMTGMDKQTGYRALLRAVKSLDVLLFTAPFVWVWMHFYSTRLIIPYFRRGNWLIIALYLFCYYFLAHLYSGFTIHISKVSEIVYSQALAAVLTNGLMFIIIWLLIRFFPDPVPLLVTLGVQLVCIVLWASLAHRWYFRRFPPKKTVIVWDELEGMADLIRQYEMEDHFEVIRQLPVGECLGKGLEQSLAGAEVVFLCSLHSHERNQIVKYCVARDITSYTMPRIGDVIMSGADRMHLFHLPILMVRRYDPKPEYLVIKRLMDIVLSGLALILFSPLMLVLAVIIRMDGGTVFYRQKRLTRNGRVFEILKFRSMRMDAEKDGVARLSAGGRDDRITPVGRFIRACRFDELPQLINILKGDMTLVGPRPERPEIAAQYRETLPEFDLRLQARAGLTGYAQVYGKYNTTPYDKLLMDLMYIARPSLAEDVKIILATIKILFTKESTEGVGEGQTTADKGSSVVDGTERLPERQTTADKGSSAVDGTERPEGQTTADNIGRRD